MTGRMLVPTAFVLLGASSMGASAALSHRYSDHVARHLHFTRQNVAAIHDFVPERPTVFPSARPQQYPYNFHETDGLSRNPNDCAVWGCIDSN